MASTTVAYDSPVEISPASTLCDRDFQEDSPKLVAADHHQSPSTLAHITQWFQRSRTSTKTRSNESVSSPQTTPTKAPRSSSPPAAPHHTTSAPAYDFGRVVMRRHVGFTHQVYGPAVRELGAGTNGIVSLHHRLTDGTPVAVKRLVMPAVALQSTDRAQRYVRQILHEAALTRTFQHPNVIATYDVYQETDGAFYNVMDYCPLDLFALIQGSASLSLTEINCYFAQMVRGLHYLHVQRRVAHRDLKLDNVCISPQGVAKLIDFGCATTSNPKYDPQQRSPAIIASGSCGSDTYMAPELFAPTIYDARKVDVWALAIIYIAMCTKHFPWDRATLQDPNFALFTKHPDQILRRMLPNQPPQVLHLLGRMLALNPNERPSIPAIMATPWFQTIAVCRSGLTFHPHQVPAPQESA